MITQLNISGMVVFCASGFLLNHNQQNRSVTYNAQGPVTYTGQLPPIIIGTNVADNLNNNYTIAGNISTVGQNFTLSFTY